MITEEEYKQWKPLIEEYEQYEFQQGTLEALYCTECQAMDFHDCFCEDTRESVCPHCDLDDNQHYPDCPSGLPNWDE